MYGTRPWRIFGEGPTEIAEGSFTDTERSAYTARDIRFTRRTDVQQGETTHRLYATSLAVPDDGVIRIQSLREGSPHLPERIVAVEPLAGGEAPWERRDDALHVTLPERLPMEHAVSLRIVLEST